MIVNCQNAIIWFGWVGIGLLEDIRLLLRFDSD